MTWTQDIAAALTGTTTQKPPTTGPVERRVVVCGAGVVGLTTALLLARRGYAVAVYAREMPDTDAGSQDWASPWAGANWTPFGTDPRVCKWEVEGLRRLQELIPTGLAMNLPVKRYAATEAGLHKHWYENVVNNYRRLDAAACPPDAVGVSYDAVSVNAPAYTQWLHAQCAALGVAFTRRAVDSLGSLYAPGVLAVVNATGLGAGDLAADPAVEPIRGQVVLVRAPAVTTCTMDAANTSLGPTRSTYVIPRPNSGGHVICGGCYEVGSGERAADPALTRSILAECIKHHPELATKGEGVDGIDVIRECVGFRPSRRGGPRLERDDAALGDAKCPVVHAYGIGPAGFQASWGMADEVCALIADIVAEAAAA